ncbi:MAG: hypothetical protein RL462_1141 [Pseudomonadota bacterium]|jgi:hypothetical protein
MKKQTIPAYLAAEFIFKLVFFAAIYINLACLPISASAQTTIPRPLGKWAIVMVESGKYTEVYADECHNHYAPPVQISQGIWRISNPFEQTIQFICVRWQS